jgi:hypothetical protein
MSGWELASWLALAFMLGLVIGAYQMAIRSGGMPFDEDD